jgi:YfiH family protein
MYKFFNQYDGVIAVMSDKADGNMKIRGMQQNEEAIQNRENFCKKIGVKFDNVANACVTHKDKVITVTNTDKRYYHHTDALITNKKGIFLSITTADCFPVILYDPKAQIIALVHAGWRGIVTKILPSTLDKLKKLGSNLQDVVIEIGPGISQQNFDFGFREMLEEFGGYNQDRYIVKGSTINKVKIDLEKIIYDQISVCGVNSDNISVSKICTFDNENFFSARRHGGDSFNAMITVVGMKK